MKFSIFQHDLLTKLQSVSRSCGLKASLPVLANILLSTEDKKLKLAATNLEIGVVKRVPAEIVEEGEITVPARTFLEVVSSLPNVKLDIETSLEQLKISTKGFSATLNGISATEFPNIPLSSENQVLLDAKTLQDSLPQITFAAATDEGRPVLTGILTDIKDGGLELVATDGFRLAHKRTTLEGVKDSLKVLIPKRTFEEVVRLIAEDLNGEDTKVEVSTSENQNQVIFKVGATQLSSRLIEGQFPSWEKIIPIQFKNKTLVDRVELLKAVKIASVFAKDSANIIKLEVSKTGLKLSSEAKELGGQQTLVDAQTEGEEIVIAFNARFLSDAVSAVSTKELTIEFSGNLSPALVKPVGEEGLEYVIMPIRLS